MLNEFFVRFNNNDFVSECEVILQTVDCGTDARLIVNPHEVTALFRKVCIKKSTGPDDISVYLLRTCAEELTVPDFSAITR